MTPRGVSTGAAVLLLIGIVPAGAGETAGPRLESAALNAPVVSVAVSATTWRTRGRVSFPIEATIRRKLTAAGLTLAAGSAQPADLHVRVTYRETKGRELGVGSSGTGTDIACDIVLEHPTDGELGTFSIQASPNYRGLITAPYVDAVAQLESNPYFYFLGELVRDVGVARRDPTAALIAALERQQTTEPASSVTALADQPNPADTLPPPEVLYARQAQRRTIDELGRLGDRRAAPVLASLKTNPDDDIRGAAQSALEMLSMR
jgi:hypothetical protein